MYLFVNQTAESTLCRLRCCLTIEVGETSAMVHPTGKRSRPQTAVGHLLHGWLGLHLGTSRPIAQDQQVAGSGKTGPKREIDTKASHIGNIMYI